MSVYLREWKQFDVKDVERHLVVVGDLSSSCYPCKHIGIDKGAVQCPQCGVYFKYIAFRSKVRPSQIEKMKESFPQAAMIDFEDFKHAVKSKDANSLFK
ncbi:MAG: hypothetical protein PHV17_03505 [Candidatus Omnitrophica bacterium]|nr:hypothetical protein [Candidatus Omnitrophota bacterium]